MREFLQMMLLVVFVVLVTGLLFARVITIAVRNDPSVRGVSDDGDRATGAVDHRVADGAEQHSLERATTSSADHDKASVV